VEFLNWARTQWDRVTAVVACVAGGCALLFGWIGVSGTTNPAGQIPYLLSGGLVAIFLLSLASTLWLSADLRDEWRKLDRLEQRLGGDATVAPASAPSGRSQPAQVTVATDRPEPRLQAAVPAAVRSGSV
jgi:hypothetical protein